MFFGFEAVNDILECMDELLGLMIVQKHQSIVVFSRQFPIYHDLLIILNRNLKLLL